MTFANDNKKEIAILKEEIEKIKARNKRVEADKAWETSSTRTLFITGSVYILAVLLMIITGTMNPFLNALIPSMGYLLSTSTYGILKSWWLKRRNN